MPENLQSIEEIEIFSDEIFRPTDFNKKQINILGICCIFIPIKLKDKFIEDLLNKRCLKDNKWYPEFKKCPKHNSCNGLWHILDNCEIHNKNIKTNACVPLKEISKRWLRYFIDLNKLDKTIKFNILFIDLNKIDFDKFGSSKFYENIYNRFFRPLIEYGLKSFFNNQKISVKNVYCDKGSMENHKYFSDSNLDNLGKKIKNIVQFKNKKIVFIDSDHKKYSANETEYYESNIIQFVDLMIGTISQCIYYLSDNPSKKENASLILPLVERLITKPKNHNSSWHYFHKQNISFFPPKIKEDKFKFIPLNSTNNSSVIEKNKFYKKEKIKMIPYNPNQKQL